MDLSEIGEPVSAIQHGLDTLGLESGRHLKSCPMGDQELGYRLPDIDCTVGRNQTLAVISDPVSKHSLTPY